MQSAKNISLVLTPIKLLVVYQELRLYVGVDAAAHFLDSLQEDLHRYIIPLIEKDVDMIWDDEAEEKFKSATHCHVCKKPVRGDKVRDHCHFTGQFRGAAHNHCNLRYKIDNHRYKLPIVFHNLRGYDAHLIFQKLDRCMVKSMLFQIILNGTNHLMLVV